MIVGIGIDSVEINRFVPWQQFPKKQLLRIFSPTEIDYCNEHEAKRTERLAARFAVKEAFYKALTPIAHQKLPFLTICRLIEVSSAGSFPQLLVNWPALLIKGEMQTQFRTHMSITHTSQSAIAMVVIETDWRKTL